MYSRETYFKIKQEILDSGLSIPGYFKKINKSASSFYRSKNIFDGDCEIKPIFVTKLDGQDEENENPPKILGPITLDADFSMNEFIMVNGLKIEGNAEFLKEVLITLLKDLENVQATR